MDEKLVSRRAMLKTAALGVAAAGMVGAVSPAWAGQADYTFADTVAWDAEYDVVVMGMGFAGLVAAEAAADEGATVLIVEKADSSEAGGNSRVCGQQIAYANGDVEGALTYYKALARGRDVPDDMLQTFVEGMANSADIIAERYGLDRDSFVDQKANSTQPGLNQFAPEYPELPGCENITGVAIDQSTSGGLYKMLRNHLQDKYCDNIDVWLETPGTSLIQDPVSKTVVGMVVDRQGETRNVRAHNGVVMACGGFENNPEMVANYLNLVNYVPQGGLYNAGDGHRMCMEIGAKMWHMDVWEGTAGGLGASYYVPEGSNAMYVVPIGKTDMNTGSIMYVGDTADRFGDETYPLRHGHISAGNNMWSMPAYPMNLYALWDKAQNDQIEADGAVNPNFADTVVACANAAEAAQVIGCTEEDVQASIADFNYYVGEGRDYAFGRPVETMRAFEGDELYVMPMRASLLNTQGGAQRNADAQILGLDGEPIPHLYSAGEFGGITSCLYQGSTNVCECFVFGWIAGKNAAAAKDELPAYELAEAVESNPAQAGAESDIEPGEAYEVKVSAGYNLGSAEGMGGTVRVQVMLGDDGTITDVQVVDQHETEGIGSNAIEQLPEQFVGLSTADEIDAVDAVSGATVTSQALKDAVKMACGF